MLKFTDKKIFLFKLFRSYLSFVLPLQFILITASLGYSRKCLTNQDYSSFMFHSLKCIHFNSIYGPWVQSGHLFDQAIIHSTCTSTHFRLSWPHTVHDSTYDAPSWDLSWILVVAPIFLVWAHSRQSLRRFQHRAQPSCANVFFRNSPGCFSHLWESST